MIERVRIADVDPNCLDNRLFDFSLPTNAYFLGPVLMLKRGAVSDDEEIEIEASGDETLRETFNGQKLRIMSGRVISARVLPTKEHLYPMNYFPGGYYHSNSLLVPDRLKWGELLSWCRELEDFYQTEFFPVATAPEEVIQACIEKKLTEQGRTF
jgi:hypothetical protein